MADGMTRRVAMAVGIVLAALLLGAMVFAPGAHDSRVFEVGWDEPGLGLLSIGLGLAKWIGKWALLGIGAGVAVKVLRKAPAAAVAVVPAAPAAEPPVSPLPPSPAVVPAESSDDRLARLESAIADLGAAIAAKPARKRAPRKAKPIEPQPQETA